MNTSLQDRLTNLQIVMPADFAERALARAQAPLPVHAHPSPAARLARPVLIGSVSLGALVGVNAAAGHYFASYGRVLADVPVAGSWIEAAGLAPSQVTSAHGSATAADHTISIEGSYADSYRTVVFLQIDGQPMQQQAGIWRDVADATLTDQSGHVYKTVLNGAPGGSGVAFEPLTGEAAGAAQLTLHVTKIYVQQAPKSSVIESVYGDWGLHLDVARSAGGESLPIPASVSAGDTTFTVTSIHKSSHVVHIEWTLSGSKVARYTQLAYSFDPMKGPPPDVRAEMQALAGTVYPAMLIGPDENAAAPITSAASTGESFPKDGPATGFLTALMSKPGQYVLEINFGGATARIPIEIP